MSTNTHTTTESQTTTTRPTPTDARSADPASAETSPAETPPETTDDAASWVARCQRQFDGSDRDRLRNLADAENEAMP